MKCKCGCGQDLEGSKAVYNQVFIDINHRRAYYKKSSLDINKYNAKIKLAAIKKQNDEFALLKKPYTLYDIVKDQIDKMKIDINRLYDKNGSVDTKSQIVFLQTILRLENKLLELKE